MGKNTDTDKGFSLIELIIAIAILIILTGLLAPQFMKYIEKSRKAVCMNNVDVVISEYQVAVIEDRDIKPEKVLDDMVKNRGLECPSKGEYSIIHTGDELFVVNCSVHGNSEGVSSDPKITIGDGVYNTILKFAEEYTVDEIIKMFKDAGLPTNSIRNDTIREYLLKEVYGGQWPKVDKSLFTGEICIFSHILMLRIHQEGIYPIRIKTVFLHISAPPRTILAAKSGRHILFTIRTANNGTVMPREMPV